MNSLSIVSNTVTMSSREIAELTCLNALAVLMSASAELLRGVGDKNHAELYAAFEKADQLAMQCAHALKAEQPFFSNVIQNGRMSATLACAGASPNAIALQHGAIQTKTYIAINRMNGLLKIGSSCNPEKRMSSLQTGAAAVPELLLVIDENIERKLHKKFAALCVFGEWFKDDGSIAEFIEKHQLRAEVAL